MAVLAAFGLSYAVAVRVRRRKVPEAPPLPVPEPRTPRDLSRPYPRPKGHRSGLNRACPVCGTGKETWPMDTRVLGWPAHQTCAEWLGAWEPPSAEVAELQAALDSFGDHRVPLLPVPHTRCWCNWCKGRAGVHGEEAVSLYREQAAAAEALNGTAAWEWHCRCGRSGQGVSADGPAAEAAGRAELAAHRGPARCTRYGEYTWRRL